MRNSYVDYLDFPDYPFTASEEFRAAISKLENLGWYSHPLEQMSVAILGAETQQRDIIGAIAAEDFFVSEYWVPEGRHDSCTALHPMRPEVDVLRTTIYLLRVGVPLEVVKPWLDHIAPAIEELDSSVHHRILSMLVDLLGDRAVDYAASIDGRMYGYPSELLIYIYQRHNLPLFSDQGSSLEVFVDFGTLSVWTTQVLYHLDPQEPAPTILISRDLLLERWSGWITARLFVFNLAPSEWSREYPILEKLGPWPDESRGTIVDYVLRAFRETDNYENIKGWSKFLANGLKITPVEIMERADSLVPLLFRKDATFLSHCGPVLAERIDEDALPEVLNACLTLASRATRIKILKATGRRSTVPSAHVLAQCQLLINDALATDEHPAFAKAVHALCSRWEIGVEEVENVVEADSSLWQTPPPLWTVTPFEPSSARLNELAAELLLSKDDVSFLDGIIEHFLDAVVRKAFMDEEQAKVELMGIPYRGDWFQGLREWAEGTFGKNNSPYFRKPRQEEILQLIGQAPVLLSTPDRVNLSVSASTVLERVKNYEEVAATMGAEDIRMMFARLSDGQSTVIRALQNLTTVQVCHHGADTTSVAEWMAQTSSDITVTSRSCWVGSSVDDSQSDYFNFEFQPSLGYSRLMRQTAQSARLSPKIAMLMIGQLSNLKNQEIEEAWLAISAAWERGLLKPGEPDLRVLETKDGKPQRVAKLAEVLEGMAEMGMLALVWPLLKDLSAAVAAQPKTIAGTPVLLEVIKRLLPHVRATVGTGQVTEKELEIPGVAELATRKGSNRTVALAREIVEELS